MQRSDQQIREYVLASIDSGKLPPGARLPTERALCETLSVSRSAVRNALGLLEGEGRIVRVPGSGSFVAKNGLGGKADDLERIISPAKVMEARLALEPPLVHLVVANASGADFERMRECVRKGAAAEHTEGFEHWDAAFHAAIAEATHNALVDQSYHLVTRSRNQAEWGELKRQSLTPERRLAYQDDHERILAALENRDAKAAERELRGHLLRVRENLLGW